ncbi:MAG TPA: hypothetical protein VKA08_08670 [Balneolales bacterium]|nr:hypothetical protein [Balneolales bacterium]
MSSKDLDKDPQEQSQDDKIYEIEVSDDEAEELSYGATKDKVNVKRLSVYAIVVVATILTLDIVAVNLMKYNSFTISNTTSENSQYYLIDSLRTHADHILGTYGIENLQKGIYRIPIDSAMALYVRENKNQSSESANK